MPAFRKSSRFFRAGWLGRRGYSLLCNPGVRPKGGCHRYTVLIHINGRGGRSMRERFRKASRWLSVAAVAGMLCLPAQSFGSSIASKDIVPADGTTGQNVTTGNGVKTGHIQDGAVTTTKIVDWAVIASKIADGAVT